MPRRVTVLLAAALAVALSASLAASAGAATKRLRIVGGPVFKAGEFAMDNTRFAPRNLTVDKGDRVVLRNRGRSGEPHTLSLVRRRDLPKSFNCRACGDIFAAHEVNEEEETIGKPRVNVGAAGFNRPGDSVFVPGKKVSFRVTADEGKNLSYLCGLHPWMQGQIRVR